MNDFTQFKELDLPIPLHRALEKMGFLQPTPVQAKTIPLAFQNKDILASAQTGTGKTAAFAIPMLKKLVEQPDKQGLILVPTRELAAQIYDVLRVMAAGIRKRGVLVVGGESFNRQADGLYREFDYIVATPGRLNDHLDQGTADLSGIQCLVLDEIDRMLEMGFLGQIKAILRHVPKERQTMFFSATLPKEIGELAGSFLKNPERVSIGSVSAPVGQVSETTIRTTMREKNTVIRDEIAKREGLVLVFARTQARTERLADLLYGDGHRVVALHGGRSQAQRKAALQKFRNGSHRIMVATDLAGRGIDVLNIEHVINYDVPETREDYIHRIGRTGRGGKTGQALTLLVPEDSDGDEIVTGKRTPRNPSAKAQGPRRGFGHRSSGPGRRPDRYSDAPGGPRKPFRPFRRSSGGGRPPSFGHRSAPLGVQ